MGNFKGEKKKGVVTLMKSTIDAVRYGIETLHISPDEMFSLIESSNGYEADDYSRWLANQIIKIAEKDGIGFSQLLVKKFSIIQSLSEEAESSIKQEWVDKFKQMIGTDNVYSVNFEYFGESLDEVDWFNLMDYDEVNRCFLTPEVFPEGVISDIDGKSDIAFMMKLSSETGDKSCDLAKSAKEYGISCKSTGSLLLYRMCSLAESFNLGKNFKFAFIANTEFLTSAENTDIIKRFLDVFNYEGLVVKSQDLFNESYMNTNFVFVVCIPRGIDDPIQDGFLLPEFSKHNTNPKKVRYSRSSCSMQSKLYKSSNTQKECYGYLSVGDRGNLYLGSKIVSKSDLNIKIGKGNLKNVIVYYAVARSLEQFGLPSNITQIVNGNKEYKKLLYNCLPVFLFDVNSNFTEAEDGKNYFDIRKSELIKSMLNAGEVLYSFEAKQLLSVCKGFLEYLGDSADGLTFSEVRKEAKHEDLNKEYLSALMCLKDYIKTLYKEVC